MQLSNTPSKLVRPFADAGGRSAIPVASQIGVTAGAASLTDGFPPLTRTPVAAGGVPPSGLDMNGILYEMSAVIRWANAGGGYAFDGAFAADTNVSGYPKGARVMRSDGQGYWFNTVDGNEVDPETSGAAAAGWVPDFQAGAATVAMASASVTLTPAQYGKSLIVITGTLTANLNVIFPSIVGEWTIINGALGNFSITAKTAAGAGCPLGTITRIVCDGGDILFANVDSPQIVPSVTDLRAITPLTSSYIQTRGYYQVGDGASARYHGKSGMPPGTYSHNGGTVILPAGGDGSSAWILERDQPLTLRLFGAKVDGVTDDAPAILAIKAVCETEGLAWGIGAGVSCCSVNLQLNPYTAIFGEGADLSTIKMTGAAIVQSNRSAVTDYVYLRDFKILQGGTGGVGLDIGTLRRATIENVVTDGFLGGVNLDIPLTTPVGNYWNRLINVKAYGPGQTVANSYGFNFGNAIPGAAYHDTDYNVLIGCASFTCKEALLLTNAIGCKIIGHQATAVTNALTLLAGNNNYVQGTFENCTNMGSAAAGTLGNQLDLYNDGGLATIFTDSGTNQILGNIGGQILPTPYKTIDSKIVDRIGGSFTTATADLARLALSAAEGAATVTLVTTGYIQGTLEFAGIQVWDIVRTGAGTPTVTLVRTTGANRYTVAATAGGQVTWTIAGSEALLTVFNAGVEILSVGTKQSAPYFQISGYSRAI